jgi:SAM-dependent methyltransferase
VSDTGEPLSRSAYFEDLYRRIEDPWDYATSRFEQEKYQATLDTLPQRTYRSALEIGCSIGVMTEMLAERCDGLLAMDGAATAVRRARLRCRHLPHVHIVQGHAPEHLPEGTFDLIVLSETGYYLSHRELVATARWVARGLEPRGILLLVHHTESIDDATMTGDDVHDLIIDRLAGQVDRLYHARERLYRIDLLERVAA